MAVLQENENYYHDIVLYTITNHEDGVDTIDFRLVFGQYMVSHITHHRQETFDCEFVEFIRNQLK